MRVFKFMKIMDNTFFVWGGGLREHLGKSLYYDCFRLGGRASLTPVTKFPPSYFQTYSKYHLNKLYSVETLGVLLARHVLYIF